MDAKFFDSLFEGDSANGVKLGMGLTGGEFWARIAGCQSLYRGPSAHEIGFDTILTVCDIDEDSLTVPSFVGHEARASYVYVLRRANGCGDEEHTFGAAVKVCFDGQGNLIETGCNDIFALAAKQSQGPKIRLVWYYYPIDQGAKCDSFNIYWDNGTGGIDYENEIATVNYVGPKYYGFETEVLGEGRFRFCVRGVSKSGQENEHLGTVQIQIRDALQQGVEMLEAHAC